MSQKEQLSLPENPVIQTGLPTAIEKLFNEKIAQELLIRDGEFPEGITSPEEALLVTQQKIGEIWHREISPIMTNLISIWEKTLIDNPAEHHLKKMLAKTKEIELLIEIMYFSELMELRNILPEVWESLVRISMLRQQWEMRLLTNWLPVVPDENFANSNITKDQLLLAVELTNELGPLFSQIYLKQMTNDYQHLLPYQVKRKNNDSYSLYDVINPETGEEKTLPIKEVFPDTIPLIVTKCRQLAQRVLAQYANDGELFAQYLNKVADFLDSNNTDQELNTKAWEEATTLESDLEKSNWPISMVATQQPYITGEIKKIDFDFLVGLKTQQTIEDESKYSFFAETAKKIATKYDLSAAEKTFRPSSITFLLFGVGTNNFYRNQGSADETANCYENSVKEVSRATILPFYRQLFGEDSFTGEQANELDELAVIATIVHELGHTILSVYQKKILDRLGESDPHSEMIDEIKADTTGIRIFWESRPTPEQAKKMLQYIVAYYASYTESSQTENTKTLEKNGEFNTYQEMAGIVIVALLNSGALVKTETGYEIRDVSAGFEAIAKISDDFLKKYNNPTSTPAKFNQFAKEIELANKQHPGFQEFIKTVTISH